MWFIEYLTSPGDLPLIGMGIFRILLGLAIILKSCTEIHRKYWNYYQAESFFYYRFIAPQKNGKFYRTIYLSIFFLRIPLGIFLMLGIGWPWVPLLLIISFFAEMKIYFKYHANLIALCLLFFMAYSEFFVAFNAIDYWNSKNLTLWLEQSLNSRGDIMGQIFIAVTIIIMYFSAAYRKENSVFSGGFILRRTYEYLELQQPMRKFKDLKPVWLHQYIRRIIHNPTGAAIVSKGTIYLQWALPVLLMGNTPMVLTGAALGVVMHLLMAIFYFNTLLHFSLTMIASYILFVDPEMLQRIFFIFLN